jgi:DNA-binding NarL/FixJ family response regulator
MNGQAMATSSKCKVFVVDDHPIVRQGLSQLINREEDLMVCGEAESAHAALEAIRRSQAEVVILDVSLDGPDGIELLKAIRVWNARLPVLILSMHDESLYAERALRAGANGYIMKQEATGRVLTAIPRSCGAMSMSASGWRRRWCSSSWRAGERSGGPASRS